MLSYVWKYQPLTTAIVRLVVQHICVYRTVAILSAPGDSLTDLLRADTSTCIQGGPGCVECREEEGVSYLMADSSVLACGPVNIVVGLGTGPHEVERIQTVNSDNS